MLRSSARSLLEKECPSTVVRRLMDDERGYDPKLWKQMADLGWTGLVLPEEFGGGGLTYVDLIVILEEMGRVLLSSPFIWTVMFAEALKRGGSPAQKRDLLPKIATGDLIATVAYMEPAGRWDAGGIAMPAESEGGGFRLEGKKLYVPDAHVARSFLVAARTADAGENGITLFIVDAKHKGITVTPLKTMDQTRKLAEVTFADVHVAADAVVGRVNEGWALLAQVLDRAKVMLAAEMMGAAQKALEMSSEYAKIRVQFGRPVGSFQAVQHKCANMLLDVESAKSVVYYASWAVTNGIADAPLAAATAKTAASDAFRRTTGESIQVHGGIGFTWEHDMHLYFKRAKSSEFTFGDASFNRTQVANLIGL